MSKIGLGGQCILLVEDSVYTRKLLKKIFFGLDSPVVLEAATGAEAVAAINKNADAITLIVADFEMPVMNGLELVQTVRTGKTPLSRSFPIAMLTGHSEEHLVVQALALDVNAFLIKPVSAKALGRRLNQVIDMAADTSWLKSEASYLGISIAKADPALADGTPSKKSSHVMDAPPPKPVATAHLSRDGYDSASPALDAAPKSPPPKGARRANRRARFGEGDLANGASAKRAGARFDEADLAPGLSRKVGALKGKFGDGDLAEDFGNGIATLAAEAGDEVAARMINMLDRMAADDGDRLEEMARAVSGAPRRGQANPPSSARVEERFTPLDQSAEGAELARDLLMVTKEALLDEGTVLTPRIIQVLKRLDEMEILLLEVSAENPEAGRGVYVRITDESPTGAGGGSAVPVTELQPGVVLARDIRLADGRHYMSEGTALSERFILLLQDLVELGRIDPEVHVR